VYTLGVGYDFNTPVFFGNSILSTECGVDEMLHRRNDALCQFQRKINNKKLKIESIIVKKIKNYKNKINVTLVGSRKTIRVCGA